MSDLSKLPSTDSKGHLHVVIETPKGSKAKLRYDAGLGVFMLSRALVLGVVYPHDWGFVPSTEAEDGDPLDAMVLSDCGTYPGVVIPSKPIGVVRLSQKGDDGARQRNDRIIAVPVEDARFRDIVDLSERTRHELEDFFLLATRRTPKEAKVEGWDDAESARKTIREAASRARTKSES